MWGKIHGGSAAWLEPQHFFHTQARKHPRPNKHPAKLCPCARSPKHCSLHVNIGMSQQLRFDGRRTNDSSNKARNRKPPLLRPCHKIAFATLSTTR